MFACFDFRQTDPFLTTFYYVEKRNGILRKNRGRGLKNFMYPYMGVGGSKMAKIILGSFMNRPLVSAENTT